MFVFYNYRFYKVDTGNNFNLILHNHTTRVKVSNPMLLSSAVVLGSTLTLMLCS